MRIRRDRGPLIVLVLLGFSLCCSFAAGQGVPADFQIVGRYGPGYSDWRSWTVTISGDGTVLQKVGKGGRGGGEPYEKKFALSKEDVAALLARVEEADFFKLKEQYRGGVTDQATLYLTITLDKRSREVKVYGHRFIRDKADQEEANRFLKIWVELLRKVPSPNADKLDGFKAGLAVKPPKAAPPADRSLRLSIPVASSLVMSVAFSPDSKRLTASSTSGRIDFWETASGESVASFGTLKRLTYALAFSPDGKTLAAARSDGVVLWDTATGETKATLAAHKREVRAVAFRRDGKMLASASADSTITLWDTATGKLSATINAHATSVDAVAFNRDGTLASGGRDGLVKLWNAEGRNTATCAAHTFGVRGVAFSPDGKILASGGGDNTVKLWDAASGKHTATLEGHTDHVFAIAFSPDGKTLASGGPDKTIRLWDVATGRNLAILHGHANSVLSVAISPNGRTLASASGDRSIKLWDLPAR